MFMCLYVNLFICDLVYMLICLYVNLLHVDTLIYSCVNIVGFAFVVGFALVALVVGFCFVCMKINIIYIYIYIYIYSIAYSHIRLIAHALICVYRIRVITYSHNDKFVSLRICVFTYSQMSLFVYACVS